MMNYRVRIEHEAERQIERLAGNIRQRIKRTIAELAVDPRPAHAKQMESPYDDKWRLRLEHYRIIYTIEDEIVLVTVIRVAKRTSSTYDDL
jgi:mRNA interferase RelE/StbE